MYAARCEKQAFVTDNGKPKLAIGPYYDTKTSHRINSKTRANCEKPTLRHLRDVRSHGQ